MTEPDTGYGWYRLPNGFDVKFSRGIPVRVSDNGQGLTVPEDVLREEIAALSRLHVSLGAWEPGEQPGDYEARVVVAEKDFGEVLHRLAVASAALFVERYNRAVEDEDVDWDLLEYRSDFATALELCGAQRGDFDMDACFAGYARALHRETRRLEQEGATPRVAPE
jgi:hypothetical protein